MSTLVTTASCPGGTTVDVPLKGGPEFASTQIIITGRATGTVTITVRPTGGDFFETVSGGALTLSASRLISLAGFSIDTVRFSDGGTGAFSVTIIQRS